MRGPQCAPTPFNNLSNRSCRYRATPPPLFNIQHSALQRGVPKSRNSSAPSSESRKKPHVLSNTFDDFPGILRYSSSTNARSPLFSSLPSLRSNPQYSLVRPPNRVSSTNPRENRTSRCAPSINHRESSAIPRPYTNLPHLNQVPIWQNRPAPSRNTPLNPLHSANFRSTQLVRHLFLSAHPGLLPIGRVSVRSSRFRLQH